MNQAESEPEAHCDTWEKGERQKEKKSRKRAVRERGLACYIRRPLLHNAVVNPCVPYKDGF